VRFCPSPTGNPHVGLIRTALYNWAFARHHGGTFVFRIEDTDSARDSEESYAALLDTLRWFGLDWDEGPEVGGPHAPYRQSQRMDLYADIARRLVEAGLAYESFSTPDEIEERRRAAGQDPKLGYDGHDRALTEAQRAAFREAGRKPVLRLRMPDEDISIDDLVRGKITWAAGSVPDYVIVRADGSPLYTLTNPVDDALMQITHVLRGEDLLSSTPRQVALHRGLAEIGVTAGAAPLYGHLPFVMGEGNRKLSKRDPQSSVGYYRDEGFVPEGLLNYLALLGWSLAEDRDVFSMAEMVEAFDIARVNANPARFDLKKCEAINADWVRRLDADDFAARATAYLQLDGYVSTPPTPEQQELVTRAAPLVQERVTVLRQVSGMLGFLFVADSEFVLEPSAAATLDEGAMEVLRASGEALSALDPDNAWTTEAIEAALRAALVEGLGLKPKHAFGPLRVAVTGRRVSPPLFESIELLGPEKTLARLRAAQR
jgi:glutamyl-tRNA synthetase